VIREAAPEKAAAVKRGEIALEEAKRDLKRKEYDSQISRERSIKN
jgi:hypothetical protein